MRHTLLRATIYLIVSRAIPVALRAQGGYEIEVYQSALVPVHSLMLELHSNYNFGGRVVPPSSGGIVDFASRDYSVLEDPTCNSPSTPFYDRAPLVRSTASAQFDCVIPVATSTAHLVHETIEATLGVTPWAELAMYAFTSKQGGAGMQLVGGTVRARFAAPRAWNLPVGLGLSTELEHENAAYSAATWTLELRPIIDRAFGRWYATFNPTISRVLQPSSVAQGLNFSPSARIGFDATRMVTPGVEWYSAYGQFGAFAPPNSRLQQFFGTVDLHPSAFWELNAGLGIGTTSATEKVMAKVVVGYRFSWAHTNPVQ